MPRFKHYVSAGHGISEDFYDGDDEVLVGRGQGNKIFGEMCRDISCLITKQIKKKQLGVKFIDLETLQALQCALISCEDNADMMIDGEESQR